MHILQEERDSLSAQLELALAKAESEELARSIAEEQISDLEKEKTILELEVKDLIARHKADIYDKNNQMQQVTMLQLKSLFDSATGNYAAT